MVQHPRGPAPDARRAARARRARRLLDLHLHQLHPDAPLPRGPVRHYHRYGLEIVGVETPEFTFEQNAEQRRSRRSTPTGSRYPVVQDNRYGTWNAYQNEYWPAEYLIDAHGEVRHTQFGEGDYQQDEAAVRELLYEPGARSLPPPMTAKAIMPSPNLGTPETYLNPDRAQGFAQPLQTGTHFYPGVIAPILNEWGLHGTWTTTSQSVTPVSAGASITGRFQAAHVYLVMTSAGDVPRTARVLLGGRPITAAESGDRRPRRAGDRPRPAPLRTRVAAHRRAAHVDDRHPAGRQRLRLHVRVAPRSSDSARARSSGELTLTSTDGSWSVTSRGPIAATAARTGATASAAAGASSAAALGP